MSLSDEMHTAQKSVMDKVTLVQTRVTQQRSDLALLRQSLTDTEVRLGRLQRSFDTLSDYLAQLHSQMELDGYLDKTMDKLIRYGRTIRLVACYVDPAADTGKVPRQCRQTCGAMRAAVLFLGGG